jgi:RNA polymerase sigma-70 factor (ECF subfamily)
VTLTKHERFTRTYRQYYWPVVRYLRRREADEEEARDLTAEVFATAWRRFTSLPEDPLPWLYTTAGNVLANSRRSRGRRWRLTERLAANAPATAGQLDLDVHIDLHAALATLSATDLEILRLSTWEDLAPAQIAQFLGCSPNAATLRVHRARQRLRVALELPSPTTKLEESHHDR